jgi:hypothetical protein
MLATLLIWLSAAVAVLALADLLLSKAQKDWLSNAVIKIWSVLDEAKAWSFADWLKNPRARWWFAISVGLLMGIQQAWSIITEESGEYLRPDVFGDALRNSPLIISLLAAWTAILVALLSRPIFARLLDFTSRKSLALRLTVFSLFALIVFVIMTLTLGLSEQSSIFPVILIASLLVLGLPALLVLLCVLTILFALGLAYVASAILYVGEFVVRRIAEYPKGPVLALSALFGGVCALIKAFG